MPIPAVSDRLRVGAHMSMGVHAAVRELPSVSDRVNHKVEPCPTTLARSKA
jgi:hypothetical protein